MPSHRGLLYVSLVAIACSSDPPRLPSPPHVTSAAPRASASAPGPPAPPFVIADELKRAHEVIARAGSQHGDGSLDGVVLANDAAAPYPRLGPAHGVEPGATVIETMYKQGAPTPSGYFAMVKRPGFSADGGDWEYLVVSPSGEIEQRGDLPLCSRCHADAPQDHLFGRAR